MNQIISDVMDQLSMSTSGTAHLVITVVVLMIAIPASFALLVNIFAGSPKDY